jgi:tRNA(Ile2) C34 agmatinyltransferase TiaS
MKVYLGFDDTDNHDAPYGTGKLVRWLVGRLPQPCRAEGVVRQQLLVHEAIPYTSHNSAACLMVDMPDTGLLTSVIDAAVDHLERHALPGSDPGLCVACEDDPGLLRLMDFGQRCTREVVTQREAQNAASRIHLSGHGGTNDGIIGAAAAVGLTASGWAGRFIEFRDLRAFPQTMSVSDLNENGIQVISVERDAKVPSPGDRVLTMGWVRPRLLAHCAVLLVKPESPGVWKNVHEKRKKTAGGNGNGGHGSEVSF